MIQFAGGAYKLASALQRVRRGSNPMAQAAKSLKPGANLPKHSNVPNTGSGPMGAGTSSPRTPQRHKMPWVEGGGRVGAGRDWRTSVIAEGRARESNSKRWWADAPKSAPTPHSAPQGLGGRRRVGIGGGRVSSPTPRVSSPSPGGVMGGGRHRGRPGFGGSGGSVGGGGNRPPVIGAGQQHGPWMHEGPPLGKSGKARGKIGSFYDKHKGKFGGGLKTVGRVASIAYIPGAANRMFGPDRKGDSLIDNIQGRYND